MHLDDVIDGLANYLECNPKQFRRFVEEDAIGGYHPDKSKRTFDFGPWEVEMQVLYAIIRAVQPLHILEVGNIWGNSTSHICEALRQNGMGYLTSIDTNDQLLQTEIHKQFLDVAAFLVMNVFDYPFSQWPHDFIFDDSAKTDEEVFFVWSQFVQYAPKGAVIVAHDSEHERLGPIVRGAIKRALDGTGQEYLSMQIDPALCGLAVARKTC